jgi:hypothetical protein
MNLPILKVAKDRHRDMNFELISSEEDLSDVATGEYALVKIESLNDRIAVEEFAEQLKNK